MGDLIFNLFFMNPVEIAMVKWGMSLPETKEGKTEKVLKLGTIILSAWLVASLLLQDSKERMQMGQEWVVDPLTRILQWLDLKYRASMNEKYPGFMPVTQSPVRHQWPETVE